MSTFGYVIFATIAGLGLALLLRRVQNRRIARLQEFARENLLRFERSRSTTGNATTVTFSSTIEGWTLKTYRKTKTNASSSASSSIRWTEWENPQIKLPSGTAMLGPALPKQAAQSMNALMGSMVGGMVLRLLERHFDTDLDGLQAVESTVGDDRGIILSTPENHEILMPIYGNAELLTFGKSRKINAQPIVIIDENSFRIRVRHLFHNPDDLRAMIDLGKNLSNLIRV